MSATQIGKVILERLLIGQCSATVDHFFDVDVTNAQQLSIAPPRKMRPISPSRRSRSTDRPLSPTSIGLLEDRALILGSELPAHGLLRHLGIWPRRSARAIPLRPAQENLPGILPASEQPPDSLRVASNSFHTDSCSSSAPPHYCWPDCVWTARGFRPKAANMWTACGRQTATAHKRPTLIHRPPTLRRDTWGADPSRSQPQI